MRRFQNKFVRLEGSEQLHYREIVRKLADEGWRLVQVLAPGAGGLWARPRYFEIVFEQELAA
jgi:hypothetical protein